MNTGFLKNLPSRLNVRILHNPHLRDGEKVSDYLQRKRRWRTENKSLDLCIEKNEIWEIEIYEKEKEPFSDLVPVSSYRAPTLKECMKLTAQKP